jgi:MFS family permease
VWGHVSDRFSNKSVLGMCGPLFIGCILAWTFTRMPDKHALTMPILIGIHVLMGIATAGVALGTWNIGLKLAPKGEATAYLATSNLVNAVSAGIAPILGGALADLFLRRELSWTLRWTSPVRDIAFRTLDFKHWDFLFVFAFLLGIYSIHRLALVKEVGEVEEGVVVHELVMEAKMAIRNFSTAAGIRLMAHFPFLMARSWKKEQVSVPEPSNLL